MDGSQFSDDIDDRAEDDELDEADVDSVEAESPENGASQRQADKVQRTDRSKGRNSLAKKKSSLRMKESLEPTQRLTDNHEIMEQMVNQQNTEQELGTD